MAEQSCTDDVKGCTSSPFKIIVVGGGPVGCLTSIFMTKYTKDVTLIEKRHDMRLPTTTATEGRSINLTLTSRGFYAMQQVGLKEAMQTIAVPVTKRVIHPSGGEAELEAMPYGICAEECISSISREGMSKLLLDRAEHFGVNILFDHQITNMDLDAMSVSCRTASGATVTVAADLFIGCDGLTSVTRQAMLAKLRSDPATRASGVKVEEVYEPLGISYKEILFPPRRARVRATGVGGCDASHESASDAEEGDYSMDCHGLHVWPRGRHFLMAMANLDHTFTGTLFLPNVDSKNKTDALPTFEELEQDSGGKKLMDYVARYYPDLPQYVPDYVEQTRAHTHSALATLRTSHWHYRHRVVILGDAAHATTPFFGQGVNLGFESAVLLDRFLTRAGVADAHAIDACVRNDRVQRAFAAFVSYHKDSATAVGELSKANFVELAYRTSLREFRELCALEKWVERYHGTRFRSRYYMITQTHIPYCVAQMAGSAIERCLLAILQLYKRRVQNEEGMPFDQVLTHAEVEDVIDTYVEPFVQRFAIDLDNPREDKFYPPATAVH